MLCWRELALPPPQPLTAAFSASTRSVLSLLLEPEAYKAQSAYRALRKLLMSPERAERWTRHYIGLMGFREGLLRAKGRFCRASQNQAVGGE
jgi:hypothetical protein